MPKFILKLPGKGETVVTLDEDDIFVGRVPTINDICIGDLSVSRQHAHIKHRDGGYTIYDLKSLNGVVLNGTRVSRAALQDGDVVRLGDVEMRVEMKEGLKVRGETQKIPAEDEPTRPGRKKP